jgi:hypothetical protein
VNNRIVVEIVHGGHEAILELLLGCDADVAQDGAGEFGKEALDGIKPGAVPVGLSGSYDAAGMMAQLIRWLGGLDEQFPAV